MAEDTEDAYARIVDLDLSECRVDGRRKTHARRSKLNGDHKMAKEEDSPGPGDKDPVGVASSVTNSIKALAVVVIALALAFDWVKWADKENAAVLAVVAAGFVVMSFIAVVFVRQTVTPMAAPRANDGTLLVRAPNGS